MKYLVLGGNGFIGLHLVKALLNDGQQVKVFDRKPVNKDFFPDNIDHITGDFADTFAVAEALTDIDVVYHLISTTVPSTSNLDIVNDIQSNLITTIRLLDTMTEMGVNKIVFFSSGGTVYGNSSINPIPENHQLNPICSYGIVKATIEKYLFLYRRIHGLNYNILRVSNPYGTYQQHFGVQGVIPTFLSKVFKKEPVTIWGDGTIERDYLYINDLIDVSVKAGKEMHNNIFNIGSGNLTTINYIIEIIEKVSKQKLEINKLPARNYDVQSISLDASRAQKKFNWLPRYNLDEGISECWEWLNRHNSI